MDTITNQQNMRNILNRMRDIETTPAENDLPSQYTGFLTSNNIRFILNDKGQVVINSNNQQRDYACIYLPPEQAEILNLGRKDFYFTIGYVRKVNDYRKIDRLQQITGNKIREVSNMSVCAILFNMNTRMPKVVYDAILTPKIGLCPIMMHRNEDKKRSIYFGKPIIKIYDK